MTLLETIADHQNKIFWLIFIIAAVLLLASLFSGGLLEIALGFVLIAVGLHKLDLEFSHNDHKNGIKKVNSYLQNVGQWLDSKHSSGEEWNRKYDLRLHNLDKKRANFERKAEKQYRDLVRKLIETETKLNRLAKTLAKKV